MTERFSYLRGYFVCGVDWESMFYKGDPVSFPSVECELAFQKYMFYFDFLFLAAATFLNANLYIVGKAFLLT